MNHAINVLLFSFDPFVAYLHIAYVLSVVWLVHRDAVVCRVQGYGSRSLRRLVGVSETGSPFQR